MRADNASDAAEDVPDVNDRAAGVREALRHQWESLLPGRSALGDELWTRWTEPHRLYHDPRHLAEALDALSLLAPGVDLRLPRLALWFHDAVLTGDPTDEERSAELAADRLTAAGLSTTDIEDVRRLVLVTRHHNPRTGDIAEEGVSDADLAILAAPPPRYDESVADLRRERSALGLEWTPRRRSLLATRLAGVTFFSAVGAQVLRPAARANMRRELSALPPEDGVPQTLV